MNDDTYTDTELLDDLRKTAQLTKTAESGFLMPNEMPNGTADFSEMSLSRRTYISWGKYKVSAYYYRFGSWNAAVKAAGLSANPKHRRQRKTAAHRIRIRDGVRIQVLKRDNYRCVLCGATPALTPGAQLHIDHIIPVSRGGDNNISNLRTLCSHCNWGKGSTIID